MTRAVQPVARPAWYALERGGWRDYVTLLHPPYTAWHLSYVVIGGCLAPVVAWQRLGAAVAAFALAVGVGAHALDELHGRPLRTKIPDRVLVALAGVSIVGAGAIGLVGAVAFQAWLALLVPLGLFLVLAYNLELGGGRFHSDVWFGLAWGGFPVLNGYEPIGFDGIPPLRESVEELLVAGRIWLGVLKGGCLAGALAYARRAAAVDVDRLVVAPWAFRRGYGRALVTALLQREPAGRFLVSTGSRNRPARRLDAGLGFRVDAFYRSAFGRLVGQVHLVGTAVSLPERSASRTYRSMVTPCQIAAERGLLGWPMVCTFHPYLVVHVVPYADRGCPRWLMLRVEPEPVGSTGSQGAFRVSPRSFSAIDRAMVPR